RRRLLQGLGAAAAGVASPAIVRAAAGPRWSGDPFALGVAAGAPASDGFVIWTKLAPNPMADDPNTPFGMTGPSQPVAYEIASDDAMKTIVQRGTAIADAAYGYSVHQSVSGLEAGRPYWYRFAAGGAQSPVGRAITLPPAGVQSLRFAY